MGAACQLTGRFCDNEFAAPGLDAARVARSERHQRLRVERPKGERGRIGLDDTLEGQICAQLNPLPRGTGQHSYSWSEINIKLDALDGGGRNSVAGNALVAARLSPVDVREGHLSARKGVHLQLAANIQANGPVRIGPHPKIRGNGHAGRLARQLNGVALVDADKSSLRARGLMLVANHIGRYQ